MGFVEFFDFAQSDSVFVGHDGERRADILLYLTACRKRHALQERLKTGIKNQRRRPTLFHSYLLLSGFTPTNLNLSDQKEKAEPKLSLYVIS